MIIFDIQKFSVYDGPGIRTSVFLKGCMMRCPWCHNPESLKKEPELSFDNSKCTSCGKCSEICEHFAHSISLEGEHKLDFSKCVACGKCVQACTQKALKVFGKLVTAAEVMQEVIKDKKYYQTSGGGITVTGGEPTIQYDSLLELLKLARGEGIHTCIETNGVFSKEKAKELATLTDLFLLDYKASGELHKELTKVDEQVVLDTLTALEEENAEVILRCPIIQGVNDSEEHFDAIRNIRRRFTCVKSAEIMAYHSSGIHKWNSLGLDYAYNDLKTASAEMKATWENKIRI